MEPPPPQRTLRSRRNAPIHEEAEASAIRCVRAWRELSGQIRMTKESIRELSPGITIVTPVMIISAIISLLSFVSVSTILWTSTGSGVVVSSVAFVARMFAWLALIGASGVIGAVGFFSFMHR
jgi:protein-S-isoprenylcysteine O-methyltransferase Ste14